MKITKNTMKNDHSFQNHPCRMLIIGRFGLGKTNVLLILIKNQDDIDKIYLYAKDLIESKY